MVNPRQSWYHSDGGDPCHKAYECPKYHWSSPVEARRSLESDGVPSSATWDRVREHQAQQKKKAATQCNCGRVSKHSDSCKSLAPRSSMLREAETLITGDRNNQYGPPTQDFKRTADLLNALGIRRVDAEEKVHAIVPSDVALIIAQVKVSRIIHTRGKRDSWVDLAGYAACGYECATEEAGGE